MRGEVICRPANFPSQDRQSRGPDSRSRALRSVTTQHRGGPPTTGHKLGDPKRSPGELLLKSPEAQQAYTHLVPHLTLVFSGSGRVEFGDETWDG
ncbi:hypothetical protein NHX12_028380 [Muraenolepis orangiensis]|uniref:Uncharacterized protein n=1 Tax=Muraenolepis orangiensis TaxID=630683 RepID=A0A9Q0EDW8_9TELE|nr:hypothetical protein NHX12_028380 [Muraenolepis orangiensis]